MFATIKKLFGKKVEIPLDSPTDFQPGAIPPLTRTRVDQQLRPAAPAANVNVPAAIAIPLKSVLSRLPETLMQRVYQTEVGEAEIFIPTQRVLSQIAKGAVKLSFGELRQMAPPGIFTLDNDRDRMLVDIPLYEILSRLDPSLLARRPVQKQVEVPPEVTGPFGGQTKVSFSTSPLKNPAAGQAPPAEPAALAPVEPSRPARPVAPTTSPASIRPAAPIRPVTPIVPAPATARVQPQPFTRQQPVQPPQPAQPIAPAQPAIARVRPVTPAAPAAPAAQEPVPFSFKPAKPVAPAPSIEPAMPELPPLSFNPATAGKKYSAPVSPLAPEPIADEPDETLARQAAPLPEAPRQPVYSPIAPEPEPPIPARPEGFRNLTKPAPITPIAPVPEPEPEPIRFSPPAEAEVPTPVPAPVAPAVPTFAGETRFLTVSLTELSQSWPDVLLKEIIAQNLSGSFVGLPFGAVEGSIKHGKIAFPWKAIRSWIKPLVPQNPSLHDTVVLDLPLKIITPLFLAELKSGRAQKKFAIDETIPNLFTGSQPLNDAPAVAPPPPVVSPRPAPMSAPPTQKPADTNYFRKEPEEKADHSTTFLRKDGTPGTDFLKRYATPNEIVGKAASLPGVEGALIALPDGLLVASRIPPTMNADTIAAFLPQIFGRVTQCTRELRLGDLNNLNFTVGNVPWKIYRVGAIYFAVFGRAGEPLPTNQLVGIAAELDRKGK